MPRPKEDAPSSIGKKVDEFSMQDFRGKPHSLADLKSSKLVVVAFLGVECPLSKLYGPRLAELAKEYESQGRWLRRRRLESPGFDQRHGSIRQDARTLSFRS